MFKKIIGFAICAAMLACMIPFAVSAYDLGYYWTLEGDNEGSLVGWFTNGTGGESDLEFEEFAEYRYLYLEFENPIDSLSFILFGDGIGWGWPERSVEVDGTSVLIDFADTEGYEDIMFGTAAKFMITVDYNTLLDEALGELKTAVLLKEGETPPAAAAPEESEAPAEQTPAEQAQAPEAPAAAAPAAAQASPRTGDAGMIVLVLIVMLSAAALKVFKSAKSK